MTTVAIIQARIGSTRLPGKVLMDLEGQPLLGRVVERSTRICLADDVVVATSTEARDDTVAELCRQRGWKCFRGSEEDVLDRYVQAARVVKADQIIRITADCPLLCPSEADRLLAHHRAHRADYSHNVTAFGSGMPIGTGVEVFERDALEASWRDGHEPHHREHVDEYICEHPERFHIETIVTPPELDRPGFRLTIDTMDDVRLVREIYRRLGASPGDRVIALGDVVALLDTDPALLEINRHVEQKQV